MVTFSGRMQGSKGLSLRCARRGCDVNTRHHLLTFGAQDFKRYKESTAITPADVFEIRGRSERRTASAAGRDLLIDIYYEVGIGDASEV